MPDTTSIYVTIAVLEWAIAEAMADLDDEANALLDLGMLDREPRRLGIGGRRL